MTKYRIYLLLTSCKIINHMYMIDIYWIYIVAERERELFLFKNTGRKLLNIRKKYIIYINQNQRISNHRKTWNSCNRFNFNFSYPRKPSSIHSTTCSRTLESIPNLSNLELRPMIFCSLEVLQSLYQFYRTILELVLWSMFFY